MKEVADIVQAYDKAKQAGEEVALATVVHVEGSSYRGPGARMLVTEKGMITGAISGGCLEGDALRKALNAIVQQKNKIVTYDTTDDDVTFGVQLGCNGIVHILFEPVDFSNPGNPVELLQQSLITNRRPVVLCTLFTLNAADYQIGTALLFTKEKVHSNLTGADMLIHQLTSDAQAALWEKTSSIRQYTINNIIYNGFIELIEPAVSLIIIGAGNDAMPVAMFGKSLGWQVSLADGRVTHANQKRFPQADKIIIGNPENVLPQLMIDDRTAFVLMTHNYNYDKAMMKLLLYTKANYIGNLGPKKKLKRMLHELQEEGAEVSEETQNKIYGPIGLDIGAETSEEVALSIIAEIKTVMSNKQGTSLRNIKDAIHERFNGDSLVPVYAAHEMRRAKDPGNTEGFTCSIDLSLKG